MPYIIYYIIGGIAALSIAAYFLQDYFIFKPEKLNPDFQFKYDIPFRVLLHQHAVNKLHIFQHFLLLSFAGAFAKAAVIHQNYVIIIAVEIFCILGPALYTSYIPMESSQMLP